MTQVERQSKRPPYISDEERAAIDEMMTDAERGLSMSDEEITALWERWM